MLVISLAPSTAAYGDTNGSSQNNEASVVAVDEGDSLSNDEADEVAANSSTEAIAKSEDDSTSGDSANILSDSAKDEDSGTTGLSEKKAEAKDYVYATADWSWLVEVSTASDMPADLMAGGSAAAVFTPLAGDELSAAESAVAAKWDGDLSGRVTAGRVSLSEGSIPADAKVTVTSLGRSANDSWAGYDFAGGELAANGSLGMNQTAQMNGYGFELDGASASDPLVLVKTTGLSEKKAEAKDYVYATADWSWLVEVSTASDMPADLMAGGSAAAVFTPLAGDELSAAESAVAAKWDGDLSGRVTAGRVSLSEGSIPADAKVTVTSLGRSANDSWAGYDFAGGELAANGSLGMNQTAQMNGYGFELDGASASDPLVLVKTTGLSEIAVEKHQYVYTDTTGAWAVEINTGSSSMPKDALSGDPSMSFAEFTSANNDLKDEIGKALSTLYDGDLSFEAGTLKIQGLDSLPGDSEVSIWRMGCMSNKAWKGYTFADGKLSQVGGMGTYFETSSYSFGSATLGGTVVLIDTSGLTEKLQPGTYTITANPYIPGSDNVVLEGVSVYLASPAFPPTMPASNNATLTVAEDGTKYLTIKFDNTAGDIFTQQNIEGGDGVEVIEAHRNDTLYEGPDGATSANGRIDRLELKLLNDSGEYSFSNCQQFPTIIGKFTNMQVRLSVDFSSAVRTYVPDDGPDNQTFSTTFTDDATGVSVEVASTDAATIAELRKQGVKLVVSKDGNGYDSAQQQLAAAYTSPLDFSLYDISLLSAAGYAIALNGNTKVVASLPTNATSIADAYCINGAALTQINENASVKDGKVAVEWPSTGTFAVVNKDVASRWYSRTLTNASTGLAWQMDLTDSRSKYQTGTITSHPEKLLGQITSFETAAAFDADRDAALEAIKQAYSGAFNDAASVATSLSVDSGVAHAPITLWSEGGNSHYMLHVPSSYCSLDGLQAFYIKANGSSYEPTLLSVSVFDGEAVVDVFPETMTEDQARARSQELFNGMFPKDAVSADKGFILLIPGSSVKRVEKTYESNGATLTLASSRNVVADKMKTAKFSATAFANDSAEVQALRSQFASSMSIDPAFSLTGVELDDEAGNLLPVSDSDSMTLTLPASGMEDPVLYLWDGAAIQKVPSSYKNGLISASITTFGAYAVVDNATAVEKNYDQVFTDSTTGVQVRVTTKNPLLGVKLEALAAAGNALHVEKAGADSDVYATVNAALAKEYEEVPAFQAISLSLMDGDATVDLKSATSVTVSFATASAKPALFSVDGSKLSKLDTSLETGVVSADVKSLGSFALADAANASERQWVIKEFKDDSTGATLKVTTREGGMISRLDGASFKTTLLDKDDDAYVDVAKFLNYTYYRVGKGTTVYDVALIDSDGKLVEPEDEETSMVLTRVPMLDDYNKDLFSATYCLKDGVATQLKIPGMYYDGGRYYNWDMNIHGFGTFIWLSDKPSGESDEKTQPYSNVAVPEGKTLQYTGDAQIGIEQNKGYYEIDGSRDGVAEATEPGKYSNVLTLRADYFRWVDENGVPLEGNPRSVTVNWEILPGDTTITWQGTVSANLFVDGKYNTVIPGATAYMTNGTNPNGEGGYDKGTPTKPVSDNAKLKVYSDGTMEVAFDVVNPVFTLRSIAGCDYAEIVDSQSNESRITSLTIKLAKAKSEYTFMDCTQYPTILGAEWHVPMGLKVDFPESSGVKVDDDSAENAVTNLKALVKAAEDAANSATVSSDGSDVGMMDTWTTQTHVDSLRAKIAKAKAALESGGQSAIADASSELADELFSFNKSFANGTKQNGGSNGSQNSSGSNEANGSANGGSNGGIATTDGHLAAGTYTVSGNVWLPKSQTGLPLNPHLSNGGFPPSSPVSSNATLVVDGSGHAYVRIPVTIQDKVMVVNNVWGSGVSFDGSTITIDLGTPSAGQTRFSGTCQVSVTIGWLAQTIAAGIFNGVWDHTWTANWEVDLGSTLPASGGGTLPAAAQAILNGANGVAAEESAAEAALAALDENGSSASESAAAKKAGSQAASDEGDAADGGMAPVIVSCIALGVVAVAAIAVWLLLSRKKRNAAAEAGADSANGE